MKFDAKWNFNYNLTENGTLELMYSLKNKVIKWGLLMLGDWRKTHAILIRSWWKFLRLISNFKIHKKSRFLHQNMDVFKIIGFYEKRTTKVKEKNNRPLSSNTSSTTKSRTGVSGFSFRRWCIFTQIAVPQKTSAIFLPHHDQKCRENRSLNRVVKGPLGAYNVA